MNRSFKIGLGIALAVVLVAVLASAVSARAVSVWVGRWQSMDIPGDGSTNTLVISGGPHGRHRLVWRETYFSVCAGAPGIGIGSGQEGIGTPTLDVSMTFRCVGLDPQYFDLQFTYDSATDTFYDGMNTWHRLTPPPF